MLTCCQGIDTVSFTTAAARTCSHRTHANVSLSSHIRNVERTSVSEKFGWYARHQARHMFTMLKFFCCPHSDMRLTATALSFPCAAVRGARATATYTCDHMHTSTMKATPPSQVLSCGRYSSPHLSSHEPSGNCAASRMNTHTERFARISAILQTF